MFIYDANEEIIPNDTEAYYETIASQEEIYLEEVEEELRAILVLGGPSESQLLSGRSNNAPATENLEEQRDHAAEQLITGDADDPPLSEDAVGEMLRMTHTPKRPGFKLTVDGTRSSFQDS